MTSRENVDWGLTPVAGRPTPRSADQAGRHRIAAESKGADRDQQQDSGTDADTGTLTAYGPIPDPPAQPRNPRWLWLIPIGAIAAGAVLGILPFLEDFGRAPDNAIPLPAPATTQEAPAQPSTSPESSTSPTPSPTSRRAPTAPTAKQTTQASSPDPDPVPLGPSSGNELQSMVQRYCDRHGGGFADARADGRWQCLRLLSSSIADLDIACRDTYGAVAYARSLNMGDPYAWQCYR
jgi:hypothetical protein